MVNFDSEKIEMYFDGFTIHEDGVVSVELEGVIYFSDTDPLLRLFLNVIGAGTVVT